MIAQIHKIFFEELKSEDPILILINYRKSSIRIRPCIILDPKFPRLVLEVFQKI